MKDDPELKRLDIAAMKARNNPTELEIIEGKIAARIKIIEKDVMGQASQGRGTGGAGGGGNPNDPFGLFN
jgi:hypothetical protein